MIPSNRPENSTASAYKILGIIGLVLGIITVFLGSGLAGISTVIGSIFIILFGNFVQIVADIRTLLTKRSDDA